MRTQTAIEIADLRDDVRILQRNLAAKTKECDLLKKEIESAVAELSPYSDHPSIAALRNVLKRVQVRVRIATGRAGI